jgi:hypothetical protein
LCIDGGGYLGLATAAFLRGTEHHFKASCHDQFDLFVGTSTGGLIALSLAAGKTANEVEALYCDLGARIFPGGNVFCRAWRYLRRFFIAKYSNKALKDVLRAAFDGRVLQDVHRLGKAVAIPAMSALNGTPRIFKTNHSPLLTRDHDVPLAEIALATASAPTYFPPAEIHHAGDGAPDVLIDGGVYANNPSLIGLVEALSYLAVEPKDLEILSVSTPRPDLRITPRRLFWAKGILGWGPLLPDLFVNAPSALTERAMVELSKRLGFYYARVALPQEPVPIPMDSASASATQALRRIGITAASSNDIRGQLGRFFKKAEEKRG